MGEFISFIIALLVTISVHEAAHAWVANYLGDPTAKYQGRITLNPLKHLDPLGTLAMFLVHFGWGKPVPVNPYNLRDPRKDQAIIALAGPMSNFATALLLTIVVRYAVTPMIVDERLLSLQAYVAPVSIIEWVFIVLSYTIDLCLVLMVFNLIPIPPLDGSKVLFAFLPPRFDVRIPEWERVGPIVLIALILFSRMFNVNIFGGIISRAVDFFRSLILLAT